MVFEGLTLLVTGGGGSVGKVLVKRLIQNTDARTVRAFDSNEHSLWSLSHEIKSDKLRLLVGDIRDKERTELALKGVDYVIHTAALKNISMTETEYNTPETLRTNIIGTLNLVELTLKSDSVKRFLFISSDKSVNPVSVYGLTKATGEKLITWANTVNSEIKFSSTRFGNVIEAQGNTFELWKKQLDKGEPITVTDPNATRYFWHVSEAADFIIKCLESMNGGEIFIPRMSEVKVGDLAYKVTGLRRNEKLHEELFTLEEAQRAEERDGGKYWVIKEK